jgi:hypothetical protein
MQCMHVLASTLVLTFRRIFDMLLSHLNPFTHTLFTNTPLLTHFSQKHLHKIPMHNNKHTHNQHKCTHTHNHSHTCTNTNTYTHTCTHIHAHTFMHTHSCTHVHAHTFMHTQTQTHTHTNTSRETNFVDSRYLSMDIYLTFNSCFLLSQISQKV